MKNTIKVYDSTWRRDVVIPIASIKYAGRAKNGGTVIFLNDNQEIFTDRELSTIEQMIEGSEPDCGSLVAEELQKQVDTAIANANELEIAKRNWQHDARHGWARVNELEKECEQLRRQYRDEEKIVDEVWKALGFACYQDCGGLTIWEHVALLKKELAEYHKQVGTITMRDGSET